MARHENRSATGSGEYGVWMAAITVVCVLSAVSAVVPVVEHLVGAALITVVVGGVVVAVIRRELRIRRRLAHIAPPPSPQAADRSRPPRPLPQSAASAAPRTGGAA